MGMGMGGPDRAARKVDAADRAQLAESPVPASRILELFRPHTAKLALLLVTVVAASVVGLAQPFLLRSVIDEALPTSNTQLLIFDTGGMVGVAALTALLGVAQTMLSTRMGNRVMHDLRVRVFEHLQRQSMAFFKRTRGGEIQSRLLQDIAGMQGVMTTVATSIASNLTTAVATGVAMVALNWRMSLISLAILPPAVWVTRRVALVRRDLISQRQRTLADLHSQVDEGLGVNGALLAKTLGSSRRRVEALSGSSAAGILSPDGVICVFAAIPAVIYLAAVPQTSGISIARVVHGAQGRSSVVMGLLNVGAHGSLAGLRFGYLDLPVEVKRGASAVRATASAAVRASAIGIRTPTRTSSSTSTYTCRPARRWRWWGRPGPGSRRSAHCWCGSPTPRQAASPSTASTCATSPPPTSPG